MVCVYVLGILQLRHNMWAAVATRKHTLQQVFILAGSGKDAEPKELMLRGTVEYGFKDGGKGRKEWGAYARFQVGGEGKELQMEEYQVYLVSRFDTLDCCRGSADGVW
jgi:hypothetical protein